MDNMDPDLALEVPDTPDRLRQPVDESSGPHVGREVVQIEVSPSPSHRRTEHLRNTYSCHWRHLNQNNMCASSATPDNTDVLFQQAHLARLLSETMENKMSSKSHGKPHGQNGASNESGKKVETIDLSQSSAFPLVHPTRCRDRRRSGRGMCSKNEVNGGSRTCGSTELLGIGSSLPPRSVGRPRSWHGINICKKDKTVVPDEAHSRPKFIDKGKGVNLCNDSQPKSEQALLSSSQSDYPRKHSGQRRLVRNGCISPCNIAKSNIHSGVDHHNGMTSIDGGPCFSFAGTGDQGNGKEIGWCEDSQPITWQRSLICNGCISPNNNAEDNIVSNAEEKGKMVLTQPSNGKSHQIHNVNPNSGDSSVDNKKGKAIVDDHLVIGEHYGKAKFRSSRLCSRAGDGVTVVADTNGNSVSPSDLGWRTTRKHTTGIYKRDEACGRPYDQSIEIESRDGNQLNVVIDNPDTTAMHGSNPSAIWPSPKSDSQSRRQKPITGKRKYSSARHHLGQSSSSTFDDSEVSYLGSSFHPSDTRSTRARNSQHQGVQLGPVIDVDELRSPEAICSDSQERRVSDDSSFRARQVESDELLARQLQEQFYNESLGFENTEEIDASIALSLLQEENAPRASTARRNQYNPRNTQTARIRGRLPSRNSSSRSTNRARDTTSTRMTQLMRNIGWHMMDMDMRLNFFEELEAAFGNGVGSVDTAISSILQVQRDFNENDYEMLLALDNNNHQHSGASDNQINNLPQTVIQTDNVEEPCAVCLEKPSVGDTIRHLPCFHKFHKECIDPWLRRKTSCPVCKSGIT
ncbi:uncharacterized protein LOC103720151 [Phoenix dactylifera]|uniref:Uncharacterized protein LOC103720151 n=1 Tax=Phoenix dactylifera TaxID=42345 RepID=A0A8B7CWZ2_PHODC|nr:uncharacterized protein LOC103720151 [Phoenix dactylifera]